MKTPTTHTTPTTPKSILAAVLALLAAGGSAAAAGQQPVTLHARIRLRAPLTGDVNFLDVTVSGAGRAATCACRWVLRSRSAKIVIHENRRGLADNGKVQRPCGPGPLPRPSFSRDQHGWTIEEPTLAEMAAQQHGQRSCGAVSGLRIVRTVVFDDRAACARDAALASRMLGAARSDHTAFIKRLTGEVAAQRRRTTAACATSRSGDPCRRGEAKLGELERRLAFTTKRVDRRPLPRCRPLAAGGGR